jgi:hypothetical protein
MSYRSAATMLPDLSAPGLAQRPVLLYRVQRRLASDSDKKCHYRLCCVQEQGSLNRPFVQAPPQWQCRRCSGHACHRSGRMAKRAWIRRRSGPTPHLQLDSYRGFAPARMVQRPGMCRLATVSGLFLTWMRRQRPPPRKPGSHNEAARFARETGSVERRWLLPFLCPPKI